MLENYIDSISDVESLGAGAIAGAMGVLVVLLLIIVGLAIFVVITNIFLFKKCGQPGWAAIIPGYNYWIKAKMVGCHWIVFAGMICTLASSILPESLSTLTSLLDLVAAFASLLYAVNLAKKFGKGTGFAVGIFLLPFIFIPMLAFGKKNVFNAEAEVKNCGFFNVNF